MNLKGTLLWLGVLSCAALLVRTRPGLRQQPPGAGWAIVAVTILVAAGVAEAGFPAHAGLLVGTLWAIFIALPLILIRVAKLVRWLRPADGWRETPELYLALALAQVGQRDRPPDLFNGLMERHGTPLQIATTTRVYLYRMRGR